MKVVEKIFPESQSLNKKICAKPKIQRMLTLRQGITNCINLFSNLNFLTLRKQTSQRLHTTGRGCSLVTWFCLRLIYIKTIIAWAWIIFKMKVVFFPNRYLFEFWFYNSIDKHTNKTKQNKKNKNKKTKTSPPREDHTSYVGLAWNWDGNGVTNSASIYTYYGLEYKNVICAPEHALTQ